MAGDSTNMRVFALKGAAVSNLPRVQAIYEAFGAGDGAGFLSHLADDVKWEQWPDN